MAEGYCIKQLIDGDGKFNAVGLDRFVEETNLIECGLTYAVVAIMGPQSSGKSTLMNHLFNTNFPEMNANKEKKQTTLGIWIAKCVGIKPDTIVMDLEGSDGRERGPDDTAFEKQIALFALALADILLINMYCKDVGLERAANKPLQRIIFQAMTSLFGPGRKKTLLFVIRDKTEIPFESLKSILLEDIQKIWNEIPKPVAHEYTPLRECFRVEVVALSHYVYEKEKFVDEVAKLRERFSNSISTGGLAGGDRRNVVDASAFSFKAQQIWKQIKESKDLDLPSINVMVANVRCDEIANWKFNEFINSRDWLELEKAVRTGFVEGFGGTVSSILDTCFSEYDKDTMYFEEGVRNSKRHDVLEKKAFDCVRIAYNTMLEHIRAKTFLEFKEGLKQALDIGQELFASVHTLTQSSIIVFDQRRADAVIQQGVHWDVSSTRDKLRSDIQEYANSIYNETIISDLRNLNLKDKEESQMQIDKMVELHKKQQESSEKQMDVITKMHSEHIESLNSKQLVGPFTFIGRLFDQAITTVLTSVRPAVEAADYLTPIPAALARIRSAED